MGDTNPTRERGPIVRLLIVPEQSSCGIDSDPRGIDLYPIGMLSDWGWNDLESYD